jgi:heat-inducible transcriptional repressor
VLQMLEERYNLLELLAGALREDGIYLRIGHEMTPPSLQECSLVAANYGVANRSLGTVSVIGPTRMDYQGVIATVRATADGLSAYLEDIW